MSALYLLSPGDLPLASPEDVADVVAAMSSHEQARFFARLADVTDKWIQRDSEGRHRVFQWEYVTNEPAWTDGAARLWREFGEYGEPKS